MEKKQRYTIDPSDKELRDAEKKRKIYKSELIARGRSLMGGQGAREGQE